MVRKSVQGNKLSVRATLNGHIPKGVWVAKAIAGWELFVFNSHLQQNLIINNPNKIMVKEVNIE
jgi:hypothetical protein